MQTIYLRAGTLEALLEGLPFVKTDEEGDVISHDHAAGWDLDLIPPGSIVTATREPLPDEDLSDADTMAVRNPDHDPESDEPGPRFLQRVVTERSQDWHANLLVHGEVTLHIDPALIVAAPSSPQRGFAAGAPVKPKLTKLSKATLIRRMSPKEVTGMVAYLDAFPDPKLKQLYDATVTFDTGAPEYPELEQAFLALLPAERVAELLAPDAP
ncbi:MAG: hypothetical protein KI785_15800 [Devosiaceae bacterium]|nr:hypothetical protein [Devosiaceae bacterium MH13]